MSQYLRALALCGLVSVIASEGCRKTEQSMSTGAVGESAQPVGPYNNLVACLDGPRHVLYVLENQRDSVAHLLHASGNGERYTAEALMNIHREMVPLGFSVRSVTMNQLLQISAYFDITRAAINTASLNATKDAARGTFLDTLVKNGVYYRCYKDAECTAVEAGHETDCEQPFWYELKDSTRLKVTKANYYTKTKFYPISHCLQGKNYCMEALVVRMVMETYDTKGCAGAPISIVESDHEFSCPVPVPPKTFR